MADEKKNETSTSGADASRKVSPDELRDLDVLDSKVDKVKGGAARTKRTRS